MRPLVAKDWIFLGFRRLGAGDMPIHEKAATGADEGAPRLAVLGRYREAAMDVAGHQRVVVVLSHSLSAFYWAQELLQLLFAKVKC